MSSKNVLVVAVFAAAVVVVISAPAHAQYGGLGRYRGGPYEEPGIVRTYTLPTYSTAAPDDQEQPQQLKNGAALVLWSLACEPSTSGTTFDNPSTSACVPAKLNLPESAYSPTGEGSARSFLKALDKCLKV